MNYASEKKFKYFSCRFIIQRMKIIDTRDIKFLTRNQEDKDTCRLTVQKNSRKRQNDKK